ncbi:MAG: GNAT family N-acetyltransferase [Thermoplasmata archaeon]|nr:GNAT family N-acetyltransferase [Thermoplasmata archaeon]
MTELRDPAIGALLAEERAFVYAFGGFGLEIPGATLVTNERLAVPRFNFVQDLAVAPDRVAGFFERALDHYYQRAIRPVFRVRFPVAAAVHRALERLGYHARAESASLHAARAPTPAPAGGAMEVRPAKEVELDRVVELWDAGGPTEQAEFRRSLIVALAHPNPEEELLPILAFEENELVASAIAHGFRGAWGVHGLATRRSARGRGVASTTLLETVGRCLPGPPPLVGLWAESDRLRPRLEKLGFRELVRYAVYELDPSAELAHPPVVASAGPRWRPRRNPD